jgi:hypothetical protein
VTTFKSNLHAICNRLFGAHWKSVCDLENLCGWISDGISLVSLARREGGWWTAGNAIMECCNTSSPMRLREMPPLR